MNTSIEFDPTDPASVELARRAFEAIVQEFTSQGTTDVCTLLCDALREGATRHQLIRLWRDADPGVAHLADATLIWRMDVMFVFHGERSGDNWNPDNLQKHLRRHQRVFHKLAAVA